MKKIKGEDLILYLYGECTPRLHARIEQALEEDVALQDQLTMLRRTIKQLDKLKLKTPSSRTLKTIMAHARSKNH